VNWADLMAARPGHRAYYRSGRPVIKIGPKGALGSHKIRPIHSALSLGQSIARATPMIERENGEKFVKFPQLVIYFFLGVPLGPVQRNFHPYASFFFSM